MKMKDCVFNLLKWYSSNKRMLPWRIDKDPYHVWISEIMLQQTRIEAVIYYYERFLNDLPTISDLAKVEDDQLLKLWEGLGYYNRAHNLKRAAQMIIEKYHGIFPKTYDEIITLSGIGEYTASAISSICFQEQKATIDGNVLRVYTRFFEDSSNIDSLQTKRKIRSEIEKILPKESGNFNEALMELGEVICLPNGVPRCNICPLKSQCLSRKNNTYMQFPVKNRKKEKKVINYTIFLFEYQGKFAIQKRTGQKLLNNLWEFPNVQGKLTKKQVITYLKEMGVSYSKIYKSVSNAHIFTHQKWDMVSYFISLSEVPNHAFYSFEDLSTIKNIYAIPTAFQPFLKFLETID